MSRAAVPAQVVGYAREVDRAAADVLGDRLAGTYLHGSAVLGGFTPDRSDIDLLLVVQEPIGRSALLALAAAVSVDRIPCPGVGLELDALGAAIAAHPPRPCPFLLSMTSGASDEKAVLGADHGPGGDPLMHIAVLRRAGLAVSGDPPGAVFGRVPRKWLLEEFVAELGWAAANASAAYQALNAARAWRYAMDGVICSKLDGASWAAGRGHDRVLAAAAAFQRGERPEPPEAALVEPLLEEARRALLAAILESPES
ncbi:MAG TPA: aminoglycoside adenylyltransferase domain-containing protein [Gaiellales bacterium]|jgi:streptomycin 3"-adenylyltransferase|nr:aminoglycoside adenylyltransferase domain-containing protein [Gaiellales bacterium]